MLVTLSAVEYAVNGHIVIDALDASDLGQTTRRVNRVATLDGGAAINDFGHSWADRTLTVSWLPQNKAAEDEIDAFVRSQAQVHVGTRDGVYLAAPQSYQYAPDGSALVLLVLDKISE